MKNSPALLLPVLLVLASCSETKPLPEAKADSSASSMAASTPSASGLEFVGVDWVVASSSGVRPGQSYRFNADSTVSITSPGSSPSTGRWTFRNDSLTIIEESIAYPTDILKLTEDTLAIRMHNPGEPTDILMVRR